MFCGWSPWFGCVWGSCLACEAIGQLKKIIFLLWWSLLFHLLTISRKGCVWGSCLACKALGQLKKIIFILWWSLSFHLLTISRKVVFKSRLRSHCSSCLISAISSTNSSVMFFSCPDFSVKELPGLPSTSFLFPAFSCVSQPLWKKSYSIYARTTSKKSHSFNTQRAPAEEMIDESLPLHREPSGLIKSCHLKKPVQTRELYCYNSQAKDGISE